MSVVQVLEVSGIEGCSSRMALRRRLEAARNTTNVVLFTTVIVKYVSRIKNVIIMKGCVVRHPHASTRGTTTVGGPSDRCGNCRVSERRSGPGWITVTATDRGAERRRLLAAVRENDDSGASAEPEAGSVDAPEPAPDGGIVVCDAPLYHCSACDRTYLQRPTNCRGCGADSFDRRTAD